MNDFIGQTVSRYHILERLGEGGMAEVYKAVDLNLDREVAIKFLRTDPKNFEKSRKRFEVEAKALAKLDHPNIVRVLDYGDYEGRPYLVMEYIPGGNLKQRLGKPMPWKQASALLIPIAEALQYAHERKIIHRDVKPSNILLKADGTPMLSDFGVAKMLEMDETMDLTGTSVGVGTPYYMAPELGKGINIDHRVDIYALGVVLYELITGKKPFEADTPLAVLLKHVQDPLPRPSEFIKGIPNGIERIIFKALAKDPTNRFENMVNFVELLNKLQTGKKIKLPILVKKRNKYLIIGLLVIVTIIGGIYILMANSEIDSKVLGVFTRSKNDIGKATTSVTETITNVYLQTETASQIVPSEKEFFFEDFEDNNIQVLSKEGYWHIVDDGTGNMVYEITGNNPNSWPDIFLGSDGLKNYYIEYKFKVIEFDDTRVPAIVTFLRHQHSNYTQYEVEIILSTGNGKIFWEKWGKENKVNNLSYFRYTIYKGMWYTVRAIINNFEISFYIDDQLVSQVHESSIINNSGIQLMNGSPGIGVGYGNQVWFDDIRVVSINN